MKGTYLLLIQVGESIEIKIGALGKIKFEPGTYVYVGSALNGIEQRVSRHLSQEKKIHWHIDYLLNNEEVEVEEVFYKETEEKEEECRTAEKISEFGIPFKNFGCSDCNCESHLFELEDEKKLTNIRLNKMDKDNLVD